MVTSEVIDQTEVMPTTPAPVVVPVETALRLDLGCGQVPREGFVGVDKFAAPNVKVVHDLLTYPWPFDDGSVTEVYCAHFLEHIDGVDRLRFFDEIYRVLKEGGTALFITPAADSNRAIQDPTHKFPPVVAEFYACYLSREWREQNKLTHGAYDIKSNFAMTAGGHNLDPSLAGRNQEYVNFAVKHYRNTTTDLFITLTKVA